MAVVREATKDDVAAVTKLWVDQGMVRDPDRGEAEARGAIERFPELFLVAERDGEIVAAVIGTCVGPRAWVHRLCVSEPSRGGGVGRLVMDELERRFVAMGADRVNLVVHGHNDTGRAFWQRRGYQEVPSVLFATRRFESD